MTLKSPEDALAFVATHVRTGLATDADTLRVLDLLLGQQQSAPGRTAGLEQALRETIAFVEANRTRYPISANAADFARAAIGPTAEPQTASEAPAPGRSVLTTTLFLSALSIVLLASIATALAVAMHLGPFGSSKPEAHASTPTAAAPKPAPLPSRIAYVSRTCTNAKCLVFWSANDGSGEHAISTRGQPSSIAPNGSRLVVDHWKNSDTQVSTVVLLDATGTGSNVLTSNERLADWSPDSKLLVVRTDSSDVHSVSIAAAETLELTTVPLPAGESLGWKRWWSPDSRHLLISTEVWSADGYLLGTGLELLDIATQKLTVLVAPRHHEVLGATWSRDGTQIAYGLRAYRPNRDSATRDPAMVWTRDVSSEGTKGERLTEGSNPIWGANLIAYDGPIDIGQDSNGYTHEHHQIWLVDPREGPTSARELTAFRWGPHDAYSNGPSAQSWTPDGRMLVASVSEIDNSLPLLVDAESGKLMKLRAPDGSIVESGWIIAVSADSLSILVEEWIGDEENPDEHTYVFDPSTGTSTEYHASDHTLVTSIGWMPGK